MKTALSILISSVLFVSCYNQSCSQCPQLNIVSANYATASSSTMSIDTPAGVFPWGTQQKTMTVDIPNRQVQLQYTRDGHTIVEHYRIRDLTVCP